ncbi:larval cuticle protein 65Ag1 [Drosophila grimshawi]|uniref:GH15646 n=1 Tax=Drosophila grimshawi TaxID=7222 RepID=B4IZU2_DROGR|nr:larval cuticle protein 65Ag1 [Drosophila grimshawi]EDV95677.1 GH15646 [Drosophila grimshawi]
MKFLIVFVALFAVALAAPTDDAAAQIQRSEADVRPDGYTFNYETSNGIAAQETGQLKNIGTEAEANSVQGSFSWVGPDGQSYVVNYIADENGFQPQGSHLPQA